MKNNRLFAGAALAVSVLALASCSNKADVKVTRYDATIDAALTSEVGYITDEDGVLVDSTLSGDSYYNIYVASDANASLFTYKYDLTDYLTSDAGARNKYVTISALTVDSTVLYTTESSLEEPTGIAKALYATNGLASKINAVNVYNTAAYTRDIDTNYAYNEAKNGAVSLAVVYAPTYVCHMYNGQAILKCRVLAPVYSTFLNKDGKEITSTGLVDSTIASVRVADISKYLAGAEFGTIKATIATE